MNAIEKFHQIKWELTDKKIILFDISQVIKKENTSLIMNGSDRIRIYLFNFWHLKKRFRSLIKFWRPKALKMMKWE